MLDFSSVTFDTCVNVSLRGGRVVACPIVWRTTCLVALVDVDADTFFGCPLFLVVGRAAAARLVDLGASSLVVLPVATVCIFVVFVVFVSLIVGVSFFFVVFVSLVVGASVIFVVSVSLVVFVLVVLVIGVVAVVLVVGPVDVGAGWLDTL